MCRRGQRIAAVVCPLLRRCPPSYAQQARHIPAASADTFGVPTRSRRSSLSECMLLLAVCVCVCLRGRSMQQSSPPCRIKRCPTRRPLPLLLVSAYAALPCPPSPPPLAPPPLATSCTPVAAALSRACHCPPTCLPLRPLACDSALPTPLRSSLHTVLRYGGDRQGCAIQGIRQAGAGGGRLGGQGHEWGGGGGGPRVWRVSGWVGGPAWGKTSDRPERHKRGAGGGHKGEVAAAGGAERTAV